MWPPQFQRQLAEILRRRHSIVNCRRTAEMKSENFDNRTYTTARQSGQRTGGRILPSLKHFSTQQTSPPVATGSISQRSSFIANGSTKSRSLSCRGGKPWPAQFSRTLCEGVVALRRQIIDRALHHWGHVPALDGGLECTTLTSTAPTLTQHFQMSMTTSHPSRVFFRNLCSLPVSGRSVLLFCLVPRFAPPLLFQAVRMACPFDQGLQLDSQWSSGDLYFEISLEDHGVSRQLVLDKVALQISVWQRCHPLQLALTAHQLLRRREGARILGDTAPSQEAFFLAQALVPSQRFLGLGVR